MDTVEIVMDWEESFGLELAPTDVENLETPRMAMEMLCWKLNVTKETAALPCPSMRAFHQVRKALLIASRGDVEPDQIRLATHLTKLSAGRNDFWLSFQSELKAQIGRPFLFFGPQTVGDLTREYLRSGLKRLLLPGEEWSRSWVRAGVRLSVEKMVGQKPFSDDDHFIRDIGLD